MTNVAAAETKLKLDNLEATYRSDEETLPVLAGVSLIVHTEEFVSLLGPSGCGKTTVLKIAAGLIKPDRGRVLLDGRDITAQPYRVGYMPQQDLLFPWKTLLQNTALPLLAAGKNQREAFSSVRELLPAFGLDGFDNYYPRQLSGGMRQRAALLRTMLIDSTLMLLDEPFGALDALTREKMQHWMLEIWERFKRTALFVTHSIDEAIYLSDRVYVISERPGKIVHEQVIDIPRPRSQTVITSAAFSEYKQILISALANK